MTTQRFYRNGELVEYTGRVEFDRATNTNWYEVRVVDDSHRIGHVMVTQRQPSSTVTVED